MFTRMVQSDVLLCSLKSLNSAIDHWLRVANSRAMILALCDLRRRSSCW